MKKIFTLILVSYLLVSCGEKDTNNISEPVLTPSAIVSNEVMPTKIISSEAEILASQEYQKEVRNLEEKLITSYKQKLEERKKEYKNKNSPSFTKKFGNNSVTYFRPAFPLKTDRFEINVNGKIYTLPGEYGEKEKKDFLARLKTGDCLTKENREDIFKYNGKKYILPSSGDCGGVHEIYSIDNISPRGRYLIYSALGYEHTLTRIIDVVSGKRIAIYDGFGSEIDDIHWINNNEQMIYLYGQSELRITKRDNFPEFDVMANFNDAIVEMNIDEKFITLLKQADQQKSYEIVIYDRLSLQEKGRQKIPESTSKDLYDFGYKIYKEATGSSI